MDPNIQEIFLFFREGAPLAREALKRIKDARVSASVESLESFVNDATSRLLDLSAVFQQKDDEIRKLQAELERLKNWADFAASVQITEIHNRKFTWKLREPSNETEAKLLYCTNCFHEQRKSILQMQENWADMYTCPHCKTELKTPSTRPVAATGGDPPRWLTNRGPSGRR